MQLMPGADAPDFRADLWPEGSLTLSDLRGNPVWLAFFRYASCPLCNLRVHQIAARAEGYDRQGLKVIAVFQSPVERVTAYVGRQAPPFPIVCDPSQTLYARYGLERSLAGFVHPRNAGPLAQAARLGYTPGRTDGVKTRLPADFLIDADGRIHDAFYASIISEHIPFERVDAFVAQTGAGQ